MVCFNRMSYSVYKQLNWNKMFSITLSVCVFTQVNVIHTANPVEHANNAMYQPQFINQVKHASVDLSGHNLANTHQASGMALSSLHPAFLQSSICSTFLFHAGIPNDNRLLHYSQCGSWMIPYYS